MAGAIDYYTALAVFAQRIGKCRIFAHDAHQNSGKVHMIMVEYNRKFKAIK